MAQEVLVENRIADGQKLIAELLLANFDVSVAFWAKTGGEGRWFFYIGSTSADPTTIGDAYRTLYDCLMKLPEISFGISEVKIIQATNPVAKDAISARDRQPGRTPVRLQDKRLGNLLAVEEAYIYPRTGQMSPDEILCTLFAMANRTSGTRVYPSRVTLNDGTTVEALIVEFKLKMPGGLTITTLDPKSQKRGEISGEDVVNIETIAPQSSS